MFKNFVDRLTGKAGLNEDSKFLIEQIKMCLLYNDTIVLKNFGMQSLVLIDCKQERVKFILSEVNYEVRIIKGDNYLSYTLDFSSIREITRSTDKFMDDVFQANLEQFNIVKSRLREKIFTPTISDAGSDEEYF